MQLDLENLTSVDKFVENFLASGSKTAKSTFHMVTSDYVYELTGGAKAIAADKDHSCGQEPQHVLGARRQCMGHG